MCEFVENKTILSPIIEPVKKINTTLSRTLACLREHDINFNFILNPQEPKGEIQPKDYDQFLIDIIAIIDGYKNYQPTFLINERVNIASIIDYIQVHELQNISLIITQQPNNEVEFNRLLSTTPIRFVMFQDDSAVRRLSRQIRPFCKDLILLADRFNLKTRNVDYENPDDELFSNDHLFYSEEGFAGFSDYLTIGNSYTDGGFLPYAVAIHLTYFDDDNNVRVHHFVSDSNEDNSDVPGKVSEALAKLCTFIDDKDIQTMACEEFRSIYRTGSYPGLGSIKKLSILNHMELIYSFLDQQI